MQTSVEMHIFRDVLILAGAIYVIIEVLKQSFRRLAERLRWPTGALDFVWWFSPFVAAPTWLVLSHLPEIEKGQMEGDILAGVGVITAFFIKAIFIAVKRFIKTKLASIAPEVKPPSA